MENSKRGMIPMQEKLKLSKSKGALTPAEKQRMQNVPYASAIGSIMYAVRCTRPDVAFTKNITSRFYRIQVMWNGAEILATLMLISDGMLSISLHLDASKRCMHSKFISGHAKDDGNTKVQDNNHVKSSLSRETIKLGDVKIEKVDTDDNLADPFTKAL
ncbi:hypothetical protein Tco_0658616 [Tanacetum coccineum]